MNLFFTLLGVVIGLYLVYNGARRLFKWIQTGLPGFCRCVFTKARFVIHFVANLIVICRGSTSQEATGVKQLNRQSVRKYLFALVKRVEQGDRHPLVEQLWQLYVAKIPLYYRETGEERCILDPLPRWMELVGDVCKSPITMMVIKFLALYVVVLFLLPYLSTTALEPLKTAELALETHLGLTIAPCVWTSNQTLCFMHTHNVLTLDTLDTLSGRTLFFKHHPPSNVTQDFLMDEHERLYYPLDFVSPRNQAWRYSIEEEEGDLTNWFTPSPSPIDQEDSLDTVQLRRYINTEQHLAPFLTQLHKEEATTCICALFLNILSNVSFLYDNSEQRWIVMKDVSIYRNNSFAELMASRISFNERSRFFKKHRQWQSFVDEELIHYDSFVVEYTDLSIVDEQEEEQAELTMKTLRRANDKLREIPYSKASLFKRIGVSTRKQVPISGSEAICFVYCDALQKAYIYTKVKKN